MRNKLLVLVLLVIGLIAGTVNAQAATPKYAVAYGYQNGTRIAILQADGKWRFDFLTRAYFGQGDIALITPEWSPDGRTLYYAASLPGEADTYRSIYTYDITARQSKPVVFLKKPRGTGDYTTIHSSPDGRYLWLTRFVDQTSRLIDIQAPDDKRVLLETQKCPGSVVAWAGDKLVTTDFLCPYTVNVIELKTGKVLVTRELSDSESGLLFGKSYAIPAQQPYLLTEGSDSDTIIRLPLDTTIPEKISDGTHLLVSADGKQAVFVKAGHLMRLNPLTSAMTDAGEIGKVLWAYTEAGRFNYWDDTSGLRLVTLTASGRTETVIYTGQLPDAAYFAPNAPYVVIALEKNDGPPRIGLYGSHGLVWTSRNESADIQTRIQSLSAFGVQWSNGWCHLSLADLPGSEAGATDNPAVQDLAINLQTGRTQPAPADMARFVSESPDGSWWLYAVVIATDDDQAAGKSKDKLIAFNWRTGEKVLLSEGEPLAQRNFHFPPESYYVWSPIAP